MTLLRLLAFRPAGAETGSPPTATPVAAARPGGNRPPAGRAADSTATRDRAPASVSISEPAPASAADWHQRLETLGVDGFAKQLARHCEWQGHSAGRVTLALDPKFKHLLQDDRRLMLEQAVGQQLGESVKLSIEVAAEVVATPARIDAQRNLDRQRAAESAIDSDPAIDALKKKFGATVRTGSVQPAGEGSNGAEK